MLNVKHLLQQKPKGVYFIYLFIYLPYISSTSYRNRESDIEASLLRADDEKIFRYTSHSGSDAGRSTQLLINVQFVGGRNCPDPRTFADCSSADRWHWSTWLVAGTCSPKSMTATCWVDCSSRGTWTGAPLVQRLSLHHRCVTDDERTPRRLPCDILNAEFRITMTHVFVRPRPNSVALITGATVLIYFAASYPNYYFSTFCTYFSVQPMCLRHPFS